MADEEEVFAVTLDARMERFEKVMLQAANKSDASLNRIEKKMQITNNRMRKGLEFRGFDARSERAFGDVERRLTGLRGMAFGGLATLGVSFGASELVQSMKEDEEAARRLSAVLKSTGQAAGLSQREIAKWAEDLEDRTGRGAAEIQTVAAQLATFTSIGRTEFLKAIEVADDLSATFGGDLQSNLDAVARALDDPIKGFGNLQKRGFALADSELKRVKAHLAAGESAKAQGIILDNLAKQVSGAAEATNQGLTKSLNQLKKQAEDTFKVFAEKGGTDAFASGTDFASRSLAYLSDNADTVLSAVQALSAFMATRYAVEIGVATAAQLAKARATLQAKGAVETLTLSMRAYGTTIAGLGIAALVFAVIELNRRFSEGAVTARKLAEQSQRTSKAFEEYEAAARRAADATGEAKVQADRLAESKRALYFIEIQQAQALAETTAQMAAQRAEMAKLAAQEATNGQPKSEAEALGQLSFAAGSQSEADRAQRQADEADAAHIKALQDLLDLQDRVRNGFASGTTDIDYDDKDGKNAAKKAEARRRAIEDMKAELDLQVATLINDQDRIRALEREAAVRQRARALVDAEITKNRNVAAAQAEVTQQRIDSALLDQMEREGREARRSLDLDLYRLEANHEKVRAIEAQIEKQERVTFWQKQGYDLVAATSMATLDLVELENARAAAAQRTLTLAREEHALSVAQLSGNDRLTKQLQDQAEIKERADRYRSEGRLDPAAAESTAREEVTRERRAATYGEHKELFASAFSGGVRAAMNGDLKDFLSNQFSDFGDRMFQKAGERLYDMIFGGVDAVSEGAAQGAAFSASTVPAITGAGVAAGASMAAAITAAGAAAGATMAAAISAAGVSSRAFSFLPGFSSGGWTGPGALHQAKGVVHADEVVWSRADVARAGGVAAVEALRRGLPGYAQGGVVGRRTAVDQAVSAATRAQSVGPGRAIQYVSFDNRGSLILEDVLSQQRAYADAVATEAGAKSLSVARSVVPAEQVRKNRYSVRG